MIRSALLILRESDEETQYVLRTFNTAILVSNHLGIIITGIHPICLASEIIWDLALWSELRQYLWQGVEFFHGTSETQGLFFNTSSVAYFTRSSISTIWRRRGATMPFAFIQLVKGWNVPHTRLLGLIPFLTFVETHQASLNTFTITFTHFVQHHDTRLTRLWHFTSFRMKVLTRKTNQQIWCQYMLTRKIYYWPHRESDPRDRIKMLMTSCNTSFSGLDSTLSSKQIEDELRAKRRKLMRRMTSSHIPMESNGIGGLVSRSQSITNFDPKEKIKFNIRGTRFIIQWETLINPEACSSRLTSLTKDDEAYDKKLKEFYFDRNPLLFGCIIDYYSTDEMHLPENMCVFAVKKELEFWDLDAEVLASCCWNKYCKAEEDQRMLHTVVSEWSSSDHDAEEDVYNAKHAALKKRLWLFMNEPHTSLGAKVNIFHMFLNKWCQ